MILRWRNEIRNNSHTHYVLKRQSERVRPFLPLHIHDYGEIFFIQKGNCICNINGLKYSVNSSHIIFTRPDSDKHCIESHSDDFEMIQLMFERKSYYFLKSRYNRKGINSIWGEKVDDFQHIYPISHFWFESNFNRLLTADGSLFELEHFLINLLDNLENHESHPGTEKNDWLDYALNEIRKPENFKKGVPGFVSLCRKSKEHVERKIKLKTGRTVSQVVNRARMHWASYMLVFTNYDIQDISYDCGFSSLGQFYKVFKDSFEESPYKYRKAKRNIANLDRMDTIDYLYNPFTLMDDDSFKVKNKAGR